MLLSYIIPTCDAPEQLSRTLQSIKQQNICDSEIIVVDDSIDNMSRLIARQYDAAVIASGRKGPGHARNTGIAHARGKYLLFLDDGVVLSGGVAEKLICALESADISFPTINFDNGKKWYPVRSRDELLLTVTTAFAMKRESTNKLDSLFDIQYMYNYEDADFFVRCKYFGLKMAYVSDAIAIHHEVFDEQMYIRRYYYELRNIPYAITKLGPMLCKMSVTTDFSWKTCAIKLVMGLLNFNGAYYFSDKGDRPLLYKAGDVLFNRRKRLASNVFQVYALILKALRWNISNRYLAVAARKRLARFMG